MEEKILIKGKNNSAITFIILGALVMAVLFYAYKMYSHSLQMAIVFIVLMVLAALLFLISIVSSIMQSITVTDKKVFGFTAKNGKIDIPIGGIESVSMANDYCFTIKSLESNFIYDFNGYTNAKEVVAIINQLISVNKEKTE